MYISVIVLPLLSACFVGFGGRLFGRTGAVILANLLIFLTFIMSSIMFYEVSLSGTKVSIELWEWFSVGILEMKWSFLFDSVTTVMLVVITSISSLVHFYSISYMGEDPHLIRFMSYLSIFTFFMIILVTSGNFGQLFLGWEGVGVSSYLLINFWFTRGMANQSAIKAIIVNRFGDIGLLFAILTIFSATKSLEFGVIFNLLSNLDYLYFMINTVEVHVLTIINLALFVGVVGKSAQMGLHTWLPDAMEGPTPVSALIHAATMVTAGVFVLIRVSPLLEYTPIVLVFIAIIGALTGFFAGTIGIFQNDLKRVIAYSTCSQLGYMVVGCGLSSYSVALFHLMNHAFFKALLFLSAGAVIHAVLDEQDMRRMGGLLHVLPYTFSMFIIGSLSLMGFPYTTGYYSKDILLELAISNYYIYSVFVYWLLLVGAVCTAFYSCRLLYLTFLSETNLGKKTFLYVHDAPLQMGFSMLILGFGSIFMGYICKDMFVGLGSTFLGDSIGYNNRGDTYQLIEAEFLNVSIKLIPIVCSVISGVVAYILYEYNSRKLYINSVIQVGIYSFFNKKWYFDIIYNKIFVKGMLSFGYLISFSILDRGIIEILGPTGIVRVMMHNKQFFLQYNTGYIFKAVFIIIISIVLFIWWIQNGVEWGILNQQKIMMYIYLSLFILQVCFKSNLIIVK